MSTMVTPTGGTGQMRTSRGGAACLLVGVAVGLVAVLVDRTLSRSAGDQAAALASHRELMQLGIALSAAGAVLVIAGVVWFAHMVRGAAPRLALVGGVLGVLGYVAVVFDEAIAAASANAARGLDVTQATAVIHQVNGGLIVLPGILTLFGDLGMMLLAAAATRIGLSRWVVVVVDIGAVAQYVGFGAGSRALAAAGFAVLLIGLALVVRAAFAAVPTARVSLAPRPAPAEPLS